jgi:outer membrane protein TolC
MQIQAYKTAQKMRNATLERLNNVLILKAYQTTVLLKEQFMGSEGSYLEYIDSEKTLFNLLIRSVDTVTESLLAKAKLYYMLGIDPQKDF